MTSYELDIRELSQTIAGLDYDTLTSDMYLDKLYLYTQREPLNAERLEQLYRQRAKQLQRARDFNAIWLRYKQIKAAEVIDKLANTTDFPEQPLKLRCGKWICNDGGIRIVRTTQSGDTHADVASRTPILITEILKNVETDNECVRIAYRDNCIWKSMVCDSGMVAESRRITALASMGIDVTSNTSKLLIDYIRDIKNGNKDVIPVKPSADHLGWVGESFVPYGDIAFDGESECRGIYDAVGEKGDYEEWKKRMGELRKNIYFRLMLDTSLASPLLTKLDTLPFILHLWGGTGTGKTVGLACAMSIWGDPRAGKLWRSMNNTVNFVMKTAATLHHIPTALDELQTIKKRGMNYDDLIMKLTEGIDRGRMEGHSMRDTSRWCNSFITTGEEPIVKSNSGGGVVNRVIELDCTSHTVIDSKGNEIIAFINDNYGHAGREFIEFVKDFKLLREVYNQKLDEILEKCNTTDKQACSMAAILVADFIATTLLFTEELPLEVEDIRDFIAAPDKVDTAGRAYDYILSMVSLNASRFRVGSLDDAWGKFDGVGAVYIQKEKLNEWLNDKGYDFDAIKKKLSTDGLLGLNTQGRYYHRASVNGVVGNYIKMYIPAEM